MEVINNILLSFVCLAKVRHFYNPPDPRIPLAIISWDLCELFGLDYEEVMPMVDKAAEFAAFEHHGWS